MEAFIGGSMSDSSKKLYLHNLKRLNDNKELKDFNFLKKTDDVMKKMPTNRNTARSYIIACVNATKQRKGFKKALDFYTRQMDQLNKELHDATSKTERYKDNEVSWDHVIEARDRLPKTSVEYVLMCLFTMMPPRRNLDYIMKIGRPEPDSNWYDGKDFYFGNYKTAGKYHTQIIHVPTELKNVIDTYLEHRPFKTNDLLVKKSGVPFKTKDIQLTLNKVIGKKVGCTMLRSIYLSSKYGNMMDELKNDTDAMSTSVSVAQSNYIKH
jgi:hypothetical protein